MTDFSNPACRIKCRSVPERAGFIEIGVVYPGHINLEVFAVNPAKLPMGVDVRSHSAPLDAVTESTKVEMTISQAKPLIELWRRAIVYTEQGKA